MNTPKTQVSKAVGDVVRFNNGKSPTIAAAMTPTQVSLFEMGEELGYSTAGEESAWAAALKCCKVPADRKIMRAGFVSAYQRAKGCSTRVAHQAFDYLARKYTPDSSRKAKSNAAKAGRKEKADSNKGNKADAPQVAAQRLAAVLHYVAKMQGEHAGDDDILAILGRVAAIAGGDK